MGRFFISSVLSMAALGIFASSATVAAAAAEQQQSSSSSQRPNLRSHNRDLTVLGCYSVNPSVPDTGSPNWCEQNNCPADSCFSGSFPTNVQGCTTKGSWSDEWCRTHNCPSTYCNAPAASAPTTTTTTTPQVPTKAPSRAPTKKPTKAPTKAPFSSSGTTTTTKSPTRAPTKTPVVAVATSAPSAAAPAPTTTGGNGVVFNPYDDITLNVAWSNAQNDLVPQDFVTIGKQAGLTKLTLAFITAASGCTATWGGSTSYPATGAKPWGKSVLDATRASGRAITISFGGAAGTDLSAACTKVADLASIYQQVINNYLPERLDFDIEGGLLGDSAAITRMVTALQTIQANNPNVALSFTLPVMPYGFDQVEKDMLKKAADAGLRFSVNIMAMDYGDYYKGDQAQNAIQAGDNVVQYLQTLYPAKAVSELYKLLIITPMIGVNDVASNVFTLAHAQTLNQYAKTKGLGGLSMWSLNRDHACASTSASATCSGGNVQTADYQFSKAFAGL